MGKKALLVIDMLRDFVEADGALCVGAAAQEIVPVIERIIAEARNQEIPIFYICDQHRPDDAEFAVWPAHCVAGSEGAKVCSPLEPREGDFIVPKRRYSGFFGTDLDASLRENGIEELVLTGVCTNICVLYTAADARMRGYKVTVVSNAVASFDPEAHRFALQEMEKTLGARVVEWKEGIELW